MKSQYVLVALLVQIVLLFVIADALYGILSVLREPVWLKVLEQWANS